MSQVILVMHEPLGAAFKLCAQHVLGNATDLTVFDIAADADTVSVTAALLDQLQQGVGKNALVLCDIYGATPFNIAQQAVKQANDAGLNAHLLTGANLCMVLKALTSCRSDLDQLSEVVRLRALMGIVDADPLDGCDT